MTAKTTMQEYGKRANVKLRTPYWYERLPAVVEEIHDH